MRAHAMASTEFVDPYLDPETGLLRNKVGAQTKSALDKAEGALSFTRLVQLMDNPVKSGGDLDELRAIHRHLFQDVYDWAGELRTVDIRKNVEGAQFFLPVSMIGRAADYAAGELRADHELRGMSRDQFIDRLAYHYDQFNYVHPFREGNGRTQRVFWNRVARDAGWQLVLGVAKTGTHPGTVRQTLHAVAFAELDKAQKAFERSQRLSTAFPQQQSPGLKASKGEATRSRSSINQSRSTERDGRLF